NKPNVVKCIVLIMLASIMLASCSAPAAAPTSAPATAVPVPTTSFVYVSPNPLGVNEFLKLGKTGLEASGKKWNATTKVLEATDPTSRQEAVQAAVNEGATIVVVFGFEFNDIVSKIAATAPTTKFLIVDQCIDNPAPNVYCAISTEHEAAFLLGVEAAMLTKTSTVGAIGALDIPFLHRYTDGFAEGAKYINPNIKIDIRWVGGDNPFSDPVRAKEQALAMASAGVDQIFAAGAGSNLGIFEAAKEKGLNTYGVDVNQCTSQPGFVVDNLLKHADVEMEQSIDAIMQKSTTQIFVYGLKSGGIGTIAQIPMPNCRSSGSCHKGERSCPEDHQR
ncbi:MAG: BMP family ABC transporter substrate-binding protein, partial [Chloroflexi bacterium]|nr:BMP family ABC transporter substrate-binding protein [Chloroflexota bacterium]